MATTKKKTVAKRTGRKTTSPRKKTAVRARKSTPAKARKAAVKRTRPAARKTTVRKSATKKTARKIAAPRKRTAKTAAASRRKRNIAYAPQVLEPKWQKKWEKDKLYRAVIDESRPKHYALTMLPYPSGDLHIGHWFSMIPPDARARFKRMQGYNVMFPMGFDAFGLNAENAAIKDGIHPLVRTYQNIERMRKQMRSMGTMFDWEREVVSADPEYYKWTQWFFIRLFEMGLAYRKRAAVDWCPKDNTTLAREQVVGENRVCERCGTPVIKKELEQWFFKTTKYADELLDFSQIDWPQVVQTLQTNWIGRSEGAEVQFTIAQPASTAEAPNRESQDDAIYTAGAEYQTSVTVFTTRPDTLWGATFMVFSPEHPLVDQITTDEQRDAVEAYKKQAARQSDIEREAADKEKTGVFTGAYAINPVNQQRIPIWIADYVLMSYGTGAIMAVPAHDERDFAFARKYDLPVVPVIQPVAPDGQPMEPILDGVTMQAAYVGDGAMINSGPFDGTRVNNEKGRKNPGLSAVIDWLQERGIGKEAVNYKYRDWLISRQRYWGAPIPMVYCERHGWNPVPEDQLPVLLPEDVQWRPTGESPLKLHPTWKNTTCPVCGGPAVRETDTMDTFMCSSWYHLRYLSPHDDKAPFDEAEYNYWMPVDTYSGGIEHATMHLLYTRFFHKALRDAGITEGNEPMMQLRNQGMVLAEDHFKMSKTRGNVVAPDELVKRYGADTVRAYLMFFARWQMGAPWDSKGIEGTSRWLRRVWTMFTEPVTSSGDGAAAFDSRELRRKLHQTLKSVTSDFERFEFNTVISSLMELQNEMQKARLAGAGATPEWDEAAEIYLKMLAPACPHIAEELWTGHLGKPYSIHQQPWPKVDEAAAKEDVIEIPVQINGKVRDRIRVPAGAGESEIRSVALASEIVRKYLEGKEPRKVIVAQGRLVSIVV
ncbi:MAG: leucine--tRNA ligase [Anaerolineae bacterium]